MAKIIFIFIISVFAFAKNSGYELSLGFADVKSHEFVWEKTGTSLNKLSELEWSIEEIPFASIKAYDTYFNLFILESNLYTHIKKTDGYMIDDDWLDGIDDKGVIIDPNRNPNLHTHRSEHDNTIIKQFYGVDLAIRSIPIKVFNTNISAGVGYRYDTLKFSASDGWYKYKCKNGYPNGCLDNGFFSGKVIDYKQEFYALYFGLYLSWYDLFINNLDLKFNLKYSNFASATDYDHHILRSTVFETDSEDIEFYNIESAITYNITSLFGLYLGVDYTKYKQKLSNVYINEKGKRSMSIDSSSFDNETIKAFCGVVIRF